MKQGNIYGKGDKARATRLHSLIVRARGVCEYCGGRDGPFDCAHLVGRSYSATRTDEMNGACLHRRCHFKLTNDPFEHVQFCIRLRGEDGYQALRAKAYGGTSGQRMDWHAELERLQEIARGMGL